MQIKLIEIFYDGDSFFFTQRPGEIAKFNQVRCWSEFDGLGESVSEISGDMIAAALGGVGYAVTHEQYEATDAIDGGPDAPSRFSAQQNECAIYIQGALAFKGAHELFPRKEA